MLRSSERCDDDGRLPFEQKVDSLEDFNGPGTKHAYGSNLAKDTDKSDSERRSCKHMSSAGLRLATSRFSDRSSYRFLEID